MTRRITNLKRLLIVAAVAGFAMTLGGCHFGHSNGHGQGHGYGYGGHKGGGYGGGHWRQRGGHTKFGGNRHRRY